VTHAVQDRAAPTVDWFCRNAGCSDGRPFRLGRVDTHRRLIWIKWGNRSMQSALPAHQECPACGVINHALVDEGVVRFC
jgi:hypothetical protein